MFLSIQQKFILDTLKKLNCVRRRQLHTLVRGRFQQDGFEITQARMDAMLRQLRAGTADGLLLISSSNTDNLMSNMAACIVSSLEFIPTLTLSYLLLPLPCTRNEQSME